MHVECCDILNKLSGCLLNILHALKSYKTVAVQLEKHLSFVYKTEYLQPASATVT